MSSVSHPLRVRFPGGVVAEVLFPFRQQGKVAILCPGAPSLPSKSSLLSFFAAHGYVVIALRYRGTWESDGVFLGQSPADDVRDVITDLTRRKQLTIIDVNSETQRAVKLTAIHLYGFSFGGPAVLLNTHHQIVKKVIAISPVIDWQVEGKAEPFAAWVHFMRRGFGGGYRVGHEKNWQKLLRNDFYNPATAGVKIHGNKVLILHAKDDDVVPCKPVIPFAKKIGATYYLKPTGGHRIPVQHAFIWKKINAFLHQK